MSIEIPTKHNFRWRKILLIKPNYHFGNTDYYFAPMDLPPLNLTYIASYLIDLNVEVEILDTKVNNLNYKQIKKKIKDINPDLVGITVFVSAVINSCYDIAKIVKKNNPNCIVVFGGRHPSYRPVETLKVDEVDIIVRGEGELTFRELILKGTPENVKGISYKSDGKIIHNPDRELIRDFENIRYPARHLTKFNKYKIFTVRIETVETSRGCPHNCKFCCTPIFNKGLWRPRPIEKIINELKMISQYKKITDILFVDDNLTANTKRIELLCERIIECKRNKQINDLSFFAQIRVDSVVKSPQMVKKMAEAGFWIVLIGIESVNAETLKDMRKGLTFNKVLKALKILHDNNIIVLGSMIIGYDLNATEDDIKKEIRFMKKVDVDLLVSSVLTPFPGTEILKELEEKDLVVTKDWSKYTLLNPVIKTHQLGSKKLLELLYYSFKEHTYLNNWKTFVPRIIKSRGIFFILNPMRFLYSFNSYLKIKSLIRKYFNGTK